MGSNAFGIDLGSSNIKIFNAQDDSFFMEKNMIALDTRQNSLLAYGDSAFDMYEKAPESINVSYPIINGVIADISSMTTLINYFMDDQGAGGRKPWDYYMAIPTDISPVEKRAFYELIKKCSHRSRHILGVEKAIADGLGMGIDVKTAQGALIVDIGYDTTEISLISLGDIVLSHLLKIGGQRFDEVIKSTVRDEYSLVIGFKTAEKLKIAMLEVEKQRKNAVVYGRDVGEGLPVEKEISTELIHQCLESSYDNIIDNVHQILERTPPELGADVYRHGIYLSGGASQVGHLAAKLSRVTGLKVNIDEEPIAAVVKGMAAVIKDPHFHSLAHTIE